jgi:thiamine biosynthesis lipoprotein ApbE
MRALAAGARLDLGGIGKGYAVDRMAELLLEWEVPNALVHGGFS